MKNKIAMVSLALIAFGTVSTAHTQPASAGSNGQQIKVDIGWTKGNRTITITGTNQYGERKTWRGQTNGWGVVETHGWWWKGSTTVNVAPGMVWPQTGGSCSANVPTWWFSNWYTIGCNAK